MTRRNFLTRSVSRCLCHQSLLLFDFSFSYTYIRIWLGNSFWTSLPALRIRFIRLECSLWPLLWSMLYSPFSVLLNWCLLWCFLCSISREQRLRNTARFWTHQRNSRCPIDIHNCFWWLQWKIITRCLSQRRRISSGETIVITIVFWWRFWCTRSILNLATSDSVPVYTIRSRVIWFSISNLWWRFQLSWPFQSTSNSWGSSTYSGSGCSWLCWLLLHLLCCTSSIRILWFERPEFKLFNFYCWDSIHILHGIF